MGQASEMGEVTSELAHAKLTRHLRLLGRRDDGYHTLRSLMVPVALYDRISIEPFPGNTEPTPASSTTSPSYRTLNRTIREIFPDVIVAPGLMLAGTDSRHYAGIADSIFRFTPVRANAEDLKRFHGTNERLSIEGYADMIRFYRRLIENSAG